MVFGSFPKNAPPKIQKKLNTLFISFKVAHSAQEAPTFFSCRWLIRKLKTIEVGFRGRQCFTMEKSFFYFYIKKKNSHHLLYSVLAIESISGVKRWIFGKKNRCQKTEKKFNTLFISFKVAHSAQEAPKKNSGRSLIRKVKAIEVGFRGRRCHRARCPGETSDTYLSLTKNL
jgi:hypothetical protein